MKYNKQHIGFKLIAIVLLCAIILPAAVKFNHIFENHKHEICKGEPQAHIHEVDLDCEFYKFNLETYNYTFTTYPNLIQSNTISNAVNTLTAKMVITGNTTPKQLRAPPYFS